VLCVEIPVGGSPKGRNQELKHGSPGGHLAVQSGCLLGIIFIKKDTGFGRLLSSPSQNPPLHNFYRFSQGFLTGCKPVAIHLDPMIRENWQLVTNEPVEFEK
jgi:hypothetical protein